MKQYLVSTIGVERTDEMNLKIEDIIIHSLLAVKPAMIGNKHCFELCLEKARLGIKLEARELASSGVLVPASVKPQTRENTRLTRSQRRHSINSKM